MKRIALAVALLLAGAARGAPPEPEPKSLGEVARRAREKREKQGAADSKTPAPTFGNQDLAERKEAGISNLSVPGGDGASTNNATASPPSAGGPVRTGAPSAAQRELDVVLEELETGKEELAKMEAELNEAKGVLNPFSTAYSQDPYRQLEATRMAQAVQVRIDRSQKALVDIEKRIAGLRKQVEMESMGAAPSTPAPRRNPDEQM